LLIGLVIYGDLDTITGGYIYDRILVERLKGFGDKIHVISIPWHNYGKHLLGNFSYTLATRLRTIKPDIILEDELNHPSLFLLNERLKDSRKFRIVSIVHHLRTSETRPGWQGKIYSYVEKKYLRSVDAFIFNSNNTKSTVTNLVGKKSSVVACPGKDRLSPITSNKEIVERARKQGPLRIAFLGNITPRKGLATLVHALAQIPPTQWVLVVVGSLTRDKKYSKEILKSVKKYGLCQRTLFTGLIADAGVAKYLRENHLLVVPSQYEGFGMAYIEAMGFGLPVIGTTAGGASEVIKHGINGFLIAPNDTKNLAAHIRQLYQDRSLLCQMSINARRSYEEFPSWRDTAIRIHGFLHSMVSPRATR